MEKINVFIIVYFIAFAVVDFLIYAKLSKYLHMSGGATREDVKLYLSEQGANGQRRLVKWLRNRTPYPDMFETMFKVCTVLTGVTALAPALIMFLNINKNTILIIVCAVAVAVISIVAALYGFSYSKKVKETFASYFDSSQYKSYTGEILSEYIESEADLYVEPTRRRTLSFTQKEQEKIDKQVKYGQRIVIIVMFTIILSIPLISLNQQNKIINSKNDDEITEQTQQEQQIQQITSVSNVQAIFDFLEYSIHDAYSETKELFSDFDFSNCIATKGEGIYFGFYELNSEESAAELQKIIKTKIINDYDAEAFDGQDESNKNFTMYSYETDNIYAVSICCDNSVIYACSNLNNEAWLKSLLNDLGYLEDF